MVWLLDISLLKLRMVDQLPTFVQAISLRLTKIPKKFPWPYPKKNCEKRKAETTLPPLYSRGVLGKYAHIVSSASRGAVTDFWNMDKSGKNVNSKASQLWLASFHLQK